MQKILLTGGAGYIGSHTAIYLLEHGYDVVIVDNLSNASRKAVDAIKNITRKSFKFYRADVRYKTALYKVFRENKIDAVVHFAGLKAVGESVDKPLMYYDNNLKSTVALLNVMKAYNVTRVVFSSSATIYADPDSRLYNEKTTKVARATNAYGTTKVMQEYILEDTVNGAEFSDAGGLKVMSLRYFNPIGAHESGDIGENPNGIPNNLAPYITQVLVGRREYLSVFGDDYDTPDGTCIRDYIHITDLAIGHTLALKYLFSLTGAHFDAINLGSGKGSSVFEVIKSFEKAAGAEVPYKITGRRAGDLPETVADVQKAKNILGFVTTHTLDDGTLDSLNWQQKHPNGFEELD
ncbi:MAG: UDP-glucose 4-epimerase GalE [Bifidobacteriaceae bacterium]|jgi:UDP-glucose 4-epimerase|nr:UDP-glucose 4-epimerase GalE [Bifidobacteriaceae bacterium]